jgi:hypothetical protein
MFETNEQAGAFMVAMLAKGIPCEYAKVSSCPVTTSEATPQLTSQEDWQTEYKAREDRTSSNIYVVGLPLEWGKDVSGNP